MRGGTPYPFEDKKGRKTWRVKVDLGYKEQERDDGTAQRTRIQKTLTGFKTKAEADAAVRRLIGSVEDGSYVAPTNETFAEHARQWVKELAHTDLKASTIGWYEDALEKWVLPHIGHRRLRSLTRDDVIELYTLLAERGNRNGEALSQSTVGGVHITLKVCLNAALIQRKMTTNPAATVRWKRGAARKKKAWTSAELRRFLDATKGTGFYPIWLLAATTGMRRGELIGLRWSDVVFEGSEGHFPLVDGFDMPGSRIRVRSTLVKTNKGPAVMAPKTENSTRDVPLVVRAAAALRAHKAKQSKRRLELGPMWLGAEHPEDDLVFPRADGAPMYPDVVSKTFEKHQRQVSGLTRISLHGLRHSYATQALEAGVPPKIVSAILGHSSIVVTLDTYTKVTGKAEAAASEIIDRLIFGDEPRGAESTE